MKLTLYVSPYTTDSPAQALAIAKERAEKDGWTFHEALEINETLVIDSSYDEGSQILTNEIGWLVVMLVGSQ